MAESCTILVVDDDERIRRALVARLRSAGFSTREAEDGEQALAVCREEATRPDLVILDVMMPEKDGFQVCHELKACAPTRDIPVVLLTALDGEAERQRGEEVGADEFLSKPFNGAELVARVQSLLGMRRLERLADERATVETLVETGRPAGRATGSTVLLVEDDDAQRQLYAAWLSDAGHAVREASTLAEATRLIFENDFDLIILDVLLPDGDARDLLRALRAREETSEVPVLLLTSLDDPRDKQLGFDAGADDYLTKPVDVAELRARVNVQLRRRAAMVRLAERLRAATWRAVTDPLTGVYGRSFFDAHLRQQLALAVRHRRPVSVLMIDIDNFKRVNDRRGHLAGDEVIRAVAERLRKRLRTADVLCRYGGDEFSVIFPETEGEAAAATAEELRALIGSSPIVVHDAAVPITVSVGVASASSGTPEALVAAADRALYRAKAMGRNRVEVGTVLPWTAPDAFGEPNR